MKSALAEKPALRVVDDRPAGLDLDRFIRHPDVRERHETIVRAPAAFVLDVARRFDMQSVPIVRGIFRWRARLLGARVRASGPTNLDSAALLRMGWGVLAEDPGRFLAAGAVCQPWKANVKFCPIRPARFAAYAEPDRVKIVWTLEAQPLGSTLTRLATETRVAATDEGARARFRRYWRVFGIGILGIRWLLLPAIRREAERRWIASAAAIAAGKRRS